MKNFILFFLCVSISTTTFSQNFLGMKIKKFGISTSYDEDRVNNLDAEYFSNLSRAELRTDLQGQNFPDKSISSMTCENSTVRLDVTVLPFVAVPNAELNLGTSLMLNRTDATEYNFWSSDYYGFNYNNQNFSDIEFYSTSNEFALDASLVMHKKFAFLNFYGGMGTNLGYTFSGYMTVDGHYTNNDTDFMTEGRDGGEVPVANKINFYESHRMKNSIHQRAFLQGGVSVMFAKRFEVGIEGRRGIGYRYNAGNKVKFTNLLSTGINVRWNLI